MEAKAVMKLAASQFDRINYTSSLKYRKRQAILAKKGIEKVRETQN